MGLIWKSQKLIDDIRNAAEVATRKGAEMVAKEARTLCPWDTGALATSIEMKKSKFRDGGWIVVAQAPGNYHRFYATFVELGTSEIKKQPYLRPALRKNKKNIVQMFEGALK